MAESEKAKAQRLRRQVIAEWRGTAPPRKEWPTKEVSQEVAKALEKLGASAKFNEEDIMNAWTQVVPPIIASHTRPSSLRDGRLEISVLQPAILYTLEREMKKEILKRLQSLFGRKYIKEVRFKIG